MADPTPTPVVFEYPKNAREFPQRPSPLASTFVAPGHYYDIHTGLVHPGAGYQPPTAGGDSGDDEQYLLPGCVPGATKDECICPSGVYTRPPKHPHS